MIATATKRKAVYLVTLFLLAAGGLFAYRSFVSRADTEPATVRVSGNIEIVDAELSFKIPGRVSERLVSEGEFVETGQVIARLDDAELLREFQARSAEVAAQRAVVSELEAGSRPEEIRQAAAAVQQARARLDELLAGSRQQEIAASEAAVSRATAEAERQSAERERQELLYRRGAISLREYDAVTMAADMATAKLRETQAQLNLVKAGPREEQIAQARAALQQAEERLALIREGPRKETIENAKARLGQGIAVLELASTRLGYATLVSPLRGVVISHNVEPGEQVSIGTPVVTVGNLERVWLRAYIDETDLGRVKIGQPARIKTDTYPDKNYEGHVSFIASTSEFTPKNVQTDKERVKLVYRIKIDVDNPNMELKAGMPADAEILLSQPK